MKTKIISTRLTNLNITKIKQYFQYATTRQVLETIIELSEIDTIFRNKILNKIKDKTSK